MIWPAAVSASGGTPYVSRTDVSLRRGSSDTDDDARRNLVVQRLVLRVPERPKVVEDQGDGGPAHPPKDGDDVCTRERSSQADPVERLRVADRDSDGTLAERLAALSRVAKGVVERRLDRKEEEYPYARCGVLGGKCNRDRSDEDRSEDDNCVEQECGETLAPRRVRNVGNHLIS